MNDTIEHQGIVESVTEEGVRVSILQVAACAECKAKSLCSSAESKEKVVDVYGRYEDLHVGDVVTVYGSMQMASKAVRLAFVYPMILLLLIGFVCLGLLGWSESTVLILMLATVAVYFCIVYALRSRLERNFRFWLGRK